MAKGKNVEPVGNPQAVGPIAEEEGAPASVRVFFAGSTRGFYHSHIHDAMPGDAIEITHEDHRALLAAEGAGKAIGVGEDGKPIIVDRPPTPPERLKVMRDGMLRESHWRIAEDEPNREAWLAYRKSLRDLDLSKPAKIAWPEPPIA